jgi:PhnB protein
MAQRTQRGAKKAVRAKAPKAAKKVGPIPSGYAAITPYLRVRGAAQALEFYKKAFGAKETVRMAGADDQIMHAEMKVFNTLVMLGDEAPAHGAPSPQSLNGTSVGLFVYTRDVDAALARAVAAGATLKTPAQDMFWGDRFGSVQDPFGHDWLMATHKEDVPPKEMKRRVDAMQAQHEGAAKPA